jgi:glucose/arabinose dehydrogenase
VRGVARRLSLAVFAAALLVSVGCGSTSTSHPSAGLVAIGAGLQGPAGLRASVYGHGPATLAALALDPRGRLWLTAAGLSAHAHDGVYVIARPGGPAQKVIAGLNDPLGVLWLNGRLYVASVGRVDTFGGFDGRRFRTRTRIVDGPLAGGENNLLARAPDGRLLMGVTATCDHCVPNSPFSGAIVSFRPDGRGLRLYARRIRAPFGLAFVPGTSDLLVSMNQRDDLGARTPGDWLALVRAGTDWRFPGCYGQGGAACAGVPQPLAVLDKHAAAGGVAVVSGRLAAGAASAALVTEWAGARVLRVALTRRGSSYSGSATPYLTGIANPLAIGLAPDGSLLVGDWASGTIYRIRAAGGA